jgi:hypothetical protein
VVKWTKAGLRATDPWGACSTPTPQPIEGFPGVADFRESCDTHDLGYDLLRWIKRGGAERRAVDALFGKDLRAACKDRFFKGACKQLGRAFHKGVDAATLLERYRTPSGPIDTGRR